MSRATILIPAHNEAEVIGRTLWYLTRGLPMEKVRVVVIANGCTDSTAARARAALPQALVIETERASKCNALNLGHEAADSDSPIVCLDADLDVTAEAIATLLASLEQSGVLAACGQMDVDTSSVSPVVRTFYKGWRTNPYFARGKFGGLFALSPKGAERVFPLPEITADDEFIRRSFEPTEIAFVAGCRFVARAPRTLSSLVRVRSRSLRGAREVARMGKPSPERYSARRMIFRALREPANIWPVAVFLGVSLWVRLSLIGKSKGAVERWERDLTTRSEG